MTRIKKMHSMSELMYRPGLLGLLILGTLGMGASFAQMEAGEQQHAGYLRGFYHIGLWTEDIGEMTRFLSVFMDLELVSEAERATGGKRVIYQDPRGQRIELLSDPSSVVPHPEFPLHPRGRVAGIAHISIQVEDVISLREELTALGYEVLAQAPADFQDGYIVSEVSEHRILFVAGPDNVTFELFEIKH